MQLEWVRPAVQDRSQRTREQLMDAAESLLAGNTFDAVTVADIVKAAQSSVGSFYGRFRSKADLLRALYARYAADSDATMVRFGPGVVAGTPLSGVVAAVCMFLVRDYRFRLGLRRAFSLAVANDPEVHRMAEALSNDTIRAFEALLRARSSEWEGTDPSLAAEMVHRVIFGVLEQDLHLGQPLSDEELAAELTAVVVRYLQVRA